MITDKLCTLSNGQAITADAVSDDKFDLVKAGRDIGMGEELAIMLTVGTAFDSAMDTGTLEVKVVSSASADLSTPTVLASSGVLAQATLIAGHQFEIKIPRGIPATHRYLGLSYDNGTEEFTAGTISAAVVKDVQDNKSYASGFVVA